MKFSLFQDEGVEIANSNGSVECCSTECIREASDSDPRHQGRDAAILERRRAVYLDAYLKNPRRWIGKTPQPNQGFSRRGCCLICLILHLCRHLPRVN